MTLLAVELVSFGFAWLLPIGLLVLREAGATSAQQVLFWVATYLLVLTPCFLWLQWLGHWARHKISRESNRE